ncbi:unnamed protein product [Closterium sp. NIES-53]
MTYSSDSATRSQWLTRDATARLAIHNHLPLAERTHFGQHKTAKSVYDAVVTRYSSPAIAALRRLILPYLFPELSAFATVKDLLTHLRTSEARYRDALKAEFLDKNPPPMYITVYFIVTRLPESLRAVKDHFLALDPTNLTVDLLEKHLLAAETSIVAIGVARGTPRTPFFEGRSGLLLLLQGSAAAARARKARVVEVVAGVVVVEVVEVAEVAVGVVAGVGALVAAVVAAVGVVVAVVAAVGVVAAALVVVWVELFRGETSGKFHTQHRCFSRLDDTLRAEFCNEIERPRWLELLWSRVDIFALDCNAILAAMYALTVSAEGDCYLCVPPDQGIEAAALGASESALPSTAPAEALHTFTLDSGASRSLARSTTVLPCPAVPSSSLSGLHLPSFSTNLVSTAALQDAMVTTTTPGGQRVSICTYTWTSRHLATFTRQPGSSLYTLTASWSGVRVRSGSSPLLVSPSVAPDSPFAPPPWSPLPATPSWHALPPPCFWSSRVFASPPALACPALPSLR